MKHITWKAIQLLLMGSVLFLCVSCGGKSIMVPGLQPPLEDPPQGHALVTFVRATHFGGAIDFGIWDGDQVVGVIEPKKYIQYVAEPGEHIFLARAENWSYVKADLEAGKNYYILTNVGMGVWKARVYLVPITKGQDKYTQENIDEWKTQFTPIMVDPAQLEGYRNRRVAQVKEAVEQFRTGNAEAAILARDDYFE